MGVLLLLSSGCQTQRQLSAVQKGMMESEVRSVFGAPDEVESGVRHGNDLVLNWYYHAFASQPGREWIYVPDNRQYGGSMQQVQTFRGVRYRKYRIVFLGGVVINVSELAPPDL